MGRNRGRNLGRTKRKARTVNQSLSETGEGLYVQICDVIGLMVRDDTDGMWGTVDLATYGTTLSTTDAATYDSSSAWWHARHTL